MGGAGRAVGEAGRAEQRVTFPKCLFVQSPVRDGETEAQKWRSLAASMAASEPTHQPLTRVQPVPAYPLERSDKTYGMLPQVA